jgi:hypothetical protein
MAPIPPDWEDLGFDPNDHRDAGRPPRDASVSDAADAGDAPASDAPTDARDE